MESKNKIQPSKRDKSKLCSDVNEDKIKFPLYVYPDTMEKIDMLYKTDNCSSKTEFIEKAIRFYCGYLLSNDNCATEFIAPQLAAITDGIVKGSEQKLSRGIFKMAVELGVCTNLLASLSDVDDDTMRRLRIMCTDEVRRINGIINFEKAVRYQRGE